MPSPQLHRADTEAEVEAIVKALTILVALNNLLGFGLLMYDTVLSSPQSSQAIRDEKLPHGR